MGGPLDILKLLINSQVKVTLKDRTDIEGLFKGYDEHLNVILYKARGKAGLDDILFIRGDLVSIISEV